MFVPERGDIVLISFDPQMGREIQKTRPALVISPYEYNVENNLALFLPITSKIKGFPYEIKINCKNIQGAVLYDQVRSMDWRARKAEKIVSLEEKQVAEILSRFKHFIAS